MKKSWFCAALASASLLLCANFAAAGWTQTLLHAFHGTEGRNPSGELVADGKGHFFGTTFAGGAHDLGVVYELTQPPLGRKAWTYIVLHSFDKSDGANPTGSLAIDPQGSLYGTTIRGGTSNSGTVFKLSPPAAGKKGWTETVLVSLGGALGADAAGGLLRDTVGNLYGAARSGGATGCKPKNGLTGCGTIFKLSPPAAGKTAWTHTVIHTFAGTDGAVPNGGLVADAAGNIYGTAGFGGPFSYGTVFRLTPPPAGKIAWSPAVLLSFNSSQNGRYPSAGLTFDKQGNLFGTASYGGPGNTGVVFELAKPAPGGKLWKASIPFAFSGADGDVPNARLLYNAAGVFYGVTQFGGGTKSNFNGNVFALASPAVGRPNWLQNVIYTFPGNFTRGAFPAGGLVAFDNGFIGTTYNGGGNGVVYLLAR